MPDRKSHLITSFSMDDSQENRILLRELEAMAGKDGWSLSKLISEALREYKNMHSPGNPQLVLGHWNKDQPFPRTLEHKHYWRPEQGAGAHWYECDCGERRS